MNTYAHVCIVLKNRKEQACLMTYMKIFNIPEIKIVLQNTNLLHNNAFFAISIIIFIIFLLLGGNSYSVI